ALSMARFGDRCTPCVITLLLRFSDIYLFSFCTIIAWSSVFLIPNYDEAAYNKISRIINRR
ncbi:MAG: hypothetical protein NWQ43_10145, partial [Dolichospermum sp.]|nr:hypothetical protein [Dolichospermum sp.]